MKRLTQSYIRHFMFFGNYEYTEGWNNNVLGVTHTDGSVYATFTNSVGKESFLQAKLHRFWIFRALIGKAMGYPNHPEGAPYISFGIQLNDRFHMILLAPQGFVYVGLTEEPQK